jgi:Zn-dependent M28 family amino/carboxypeptidase
LLAAPLWAEQIQFAPAPKSSIEKRVLEYTGTDQDRQTTLKKLFQEDGCPQLSEQAVNGQRLPNLICVLPGNSGRIIIVGAHYDHVDKSTGVIDNWSGASLLPSLLHSLEGVARSHTFIFVGFTAEEKGLIGSKYYVNHISREEKPRVDAMINLDTLGLGPTKVWATHASPELLQGLSRVAATLQLPIAAFNVDGMGSSDSEPFREKQVPAITIHSATQETLRFLHSPEDNPQHLRLDDYYDSYRLVAAYLAYLDTSLPPAKAPQPAIKATQP